MSEQAVEQSDSRRSTEGAGKYAPVAELGRGGMATALLSVVRGPSGFNKLVVVKRLRRDLASEPESLRMFLDEARLAARIDHPNVVHTFEVGMDAEGCFIAMEFVDGQPFENVWRRAKRAAAQDSAIEAIDAAPGVPVHLSLHVIGSVLDALDFAHGLKGFDGTPLNVVHRDVSPHNVMVTYEGHVKLLDFGIAKAADSTAETRTGVIKGKCGYMAPEQFGSGTVDRRSDLFAVGAMLWQALAGSKMWRGLSDVEIFQRLATGDVPSPRSIAPAVDPALEAICMKALAPDTAKRFQSAADFRSELDAYLAQHRELNASARALGKYVSDLFEKDRAEIHALIETQVAKSGGDAIDRSMDLSEFFGSSPGSRSSRTSQVLPPHSNTAPPGSLPSRKKRRWAVALVAGLAAATAAAAVIENRSAAPVVKPATKASTQVTVHVSPPGARVSVDGTPLEGLPPRGVFDLDGVPHRLHAEADGYSPHDDTILLDSDRVNIDVSLQPVPVPAAVPTAEANAVNSLPTPRPRSGTRTPHVEPAPEPSATTSVAAPVPTVTAAPPAPAVPAPSHPPASGPQLDQSDPWANRGH